MIDVKIFIDRELDKFNSSIINKSMSLKDIVII